MDLQAQILNYLNNAQPPYSEGVAILEAVGLADGFRRVHVREADHRKLREKLEGIAALLDQQPGSQAAAARPETPAAPDELQRLREQAKTLHKRQAFVHARMVEISSQADSPKKKELLYELSREMMEEIVPRLDAIYDNIRHRERTGEWLYPITTEAGKVASLVKARNTERTAASRWRRLIRQSDSDDAKRMEYENKLEASLQRIAELQRAINEC